MIYNQTTSNSIPLLFLSKKAPPDLTINKEHKSTPIGYRIEKWIDVSTTNILDASK